MSSERSGSLVIFGAGPSRRAPSLAIPGGPPSAPRRPEPLPAPAGRLHIVSPLPGPGPRLPASCCRRRFAPRDPAQQDAGVPGFELPTSLACGSELDPAWIARLPRIVAGLVRRWSLEVGPPFQPGGCASWVAPARTGTGEHVVLKVGWRHDEALHEAA